MKRSIRPLCLAAGLLLLGIAVPGASAATRSTASRPLRIAPAFHLVASDVLGVFGNGRYAVIEDTLAPGGFTVEDATTGRVTQLLKPGCGISEGSGRALFQPLGEQWLMVNCGTEEYPQPELYNLASGRWRTIAVTDPTLHSPDCIYFIGTCGTFPVAVGNRWIEFDTTCYHCSDTLGFQNIDTSQVRPRPPTPPGTLIDLDSATLTEALCRPVAGINPRVVQLLGRFVIIHGNGRYVLGHCGTNLTRPFDPRFWGLAAEEKLLVWEGPPPEASLHGLTLPGQRSLTIALPHQLDFPTEIALAGRDLFLENSTSQLWSTHLPRAVISSSRADGGT